MYIVWINDEEFVGFKDRKEAMYAATGRSSFICGVSALGDHVRDGGDSDAQYEMVEVSDLETTRALSGNARFFREQYMGFFAKDEYDRSK